MGSLGAPDPAGQVADLALAPAGPLGLPEGVLQVPQFQPGQGRPGGE